jgi:hypothetical protein
MSGCEAARLREDIFDLLEAKPEILESAASVQAQGPIRLKTCGQIMDLDP